MQDQTVPQTRLTFDEFDIPDARLDTPATAEQITETILDELASDGYDPDTITLEFTDGGRAVAIFDGSNDFRTKLGTVTITAPKPDYWLALADDLRQAADRFVTLAGTPAPSIGSMLHLAVGLYTERGHQINAPVVDAIATAFGVTARDEKTASMWERIATAQLGKLRVHPYARIPAPVDPEKAALAARVAELEAQLAEGGAR